MAERSELRPRRVGAMALVGDGEDPRPPRQEATVQMTLRATPEVLDRFRSMAADLRYTHGQMLQVLMSPHIRASSEQVRRFQALALAERRSADEVLGRLLDAYGEPKL